MIESEISCNYWLIKIQMFFFVDRKVGMVYNALSFCKKKIFFLQKKTGFFFKKNIVAKKKAMPIKRMFTGRRGFFEK